MVSDECKYGGERWIDIESMEKTKQLEQHDRKQKEKSKSEDNLSSFLLFIRI